MSTHFSIHFRKKAECFRRGQICAFLTASALNDWKCGFCTVMSVKCMIWKLRVCLPRHRPEYAMGFGIDCDGSRWMKQYYHGRTEKEPYFEGWYMKYQTRDGRALALIPALHIDASGQRSAPQSDAVRRDDTAGRNSIYRMYLRDHLQRQGISAGHLSRRQSGEMVAQRRRDPAGKVPPENRNTGRKWSASPGASGRIHAAHHSGKPLCESTVPFLGRQRTAV